MQGVEDLVRRLRANDPKLVSLAVLRHRKLGVEVGWSGELGGPVPIPESPS